MEAHEMKIRDYDDQILLINGYLKCFPIKEDERKATSFPEVEILDILSFDVRNSQENFKKLNFDTQASTANELIDLYKCISYGESAN